MRKDTGGAILQSPVMVKSQDARTLALARIKEAMTATGMSASRLASAAGLAPSTLNRFLKSPETWPVPNTTTLAAIAGVVRQHAGEAVEVDQQDRIMAKAIDLARALQVDISGPKAVRFARLLNQLGDAPADEREQIIESMIALVKN
jgi:transcriptional regulator with XRE-family HTH domain